MLKQSPPYRMEQKVDSEMLVPCDATGSPQPTVDWYRNAVHVNNTDRSHCLSALVCCLTRYCTYGLQLKYVLQQGEQFLIITCEILCIYLKAPWLSKTLIHISTSYYSAQSVDLPICCCGFVACSNKWLFRRSLSTNFQVLKLERLTSDILIQLTC